MPGHQDLVLIRHAAPEPTASSPASQWSLSAEGRQAASRLAVPLQGMIDVIVTSTEPKARETGAIVARELGVSVCEASEQLHEQERSSVPLLASAAEFRARVIEALSRPSELVFGDESVAAAHRRFSAGVQHALARYPSVRLGLVTHGTVMAYLIAQANCLDPVEVWLRLEMPCAVRLSAHDFRLDLSWGHGLKLATKIP